MDQKCWCPTMKLVLQDKNLFNFVVVVVLNVHTLSPFNKRTGWKERINNIKCLKHCFSAQQQCTQSSNCITFLIQFQFSITRSTPANFFIGRELRSRLYLLKPEDAQDKNIYQFKNLSQTGSCRREIRLSCECMEKPGNGNGE